MVTETGTFGAATVLTVVGLVVMLYGVSLDNGMTFNSTMAAGSAAVVVGVGLILVGVMRLEAAEPE